MTREKLILELQQEYADRREENMRLYDQRREEACQRCSGLRQLLDARHAAILSGVRTSLLSRSKKPGENAQLPNAMALMNQRIAETLAEGGLPANALEPVYTCPICRDEGYVYEPSRQMCRCMQQELNRRMLDVLGLGASAASFETFDESLFNEEKLEGEKLSQRQRALMARNTCQQYADSFPATVTPNLLLMGKSGLGKTFLLHAIAHRLVERDVMPAYTSAYHLLEVARKAYFENDSSRLAGLMEAPVLLIDDLGTEPLMQNITIEQLFNLLNERQMNRRHTVISTNLTMAELKERYTERIASRLQDDTSWRRLMLTGDDVRRKLKRGSEKA
ncbi:MAG: AAA family ATPase [Clostridiales bacterium]|nr:AAA family ATPase [Clostridiales bacterium]